MELIGILNEEYYDFIKNNVCEPTQLLINPEDCKTIMSCIQGFMQNNGYGYIPESGAVTFRGIKTIRSLDIDEGKPLFVTTRFQQ